MSQNKTTHSYTRYPQSAVIPFQLKNDKFKILLITSIRKQQWIFPKGIIEKNMTAQESALMEAGEEAGIEGDVLNIELGTYSYSKWGGICEVKVFPMNVTKVLDTWPESDLRKRKWVTIKKAKQLIVKEELHNMLEQFAKKRKSIEAEISNYKS